MTSPTADGQGWPTTEGMRLKFLLDGAEATVWWTEGITAYVKFDDGRYGNYDTSPIPGRSRNYICERFEPLPPPPTSGEGA